MSEAHLTTAPAGEPIDRRRLDATVANLRTAERGLVDLTAAVAGARDRLAGAPDDPEARRGAGLALLRLRGDGAALADQLAALAREWAS